MTGFFRLCGPGVPAFIPGAGVSPPRSEIGTADQLLDAIARLVEPRLKHQPRPQGFRLLRPAEAAKLLGLSRSALYTKIQAGEIPAVRDGRTLMLDVRDLETWAKARKGLG